MYKIDKPMVSIIVPVYNVEKYIKKCIESLINQTYKNIEIILVDDGSTDKSGKICDEYERKYRNINVLHQKNQGLSMARNNGMLLSQGSLIGFVDSDDWVSSEMFEKLVFAILSTNTDIAMCGYNNCYPSATIPSCIASNNLSILSRKEFLDCLITKKTKYVVWNKLFRREFLNGVFFEKGRIFEDVYFLNQLLRKEVSMSYIETPLYNYSLGREGSTVSFFDMERLTVLDEFSDFLSFLEQLYNNTELLNYKIYLQSFLMNLYYQAKLHGINKAIEKTIDSAKNTFEVDRKYLYKICGFKTYLDHTLFYHYPNMWFEIKNLTERRL